VFIPGLLGALTPRGGAGAFPKLSDSSGPPGTIGLPGAIGRKLKVHFIPNQVKKQKDLPGGGGMLGGPPGIGCCCKTGLAAGGSSLGSTSSHSEDKSPELNLKQI
jgi:hypothetical protein